MGAPDHEDVGYGPEDAGCCEAGDGDVVVGYRDMLGEDVGEHFCCS